MSETSRELGALAPALFLPRTFEFGAVPSTPTSVRRQVPSLGPLSAFTGTFTGHGFNTIFRPDSGSPAKLPNPVGPSDNLLELNLTSQTLSFSRPLGSVPNRGEVQPDIFLNGVSYLLTVSDITNPAKPIGIHFEPGLWMSVPATKDPAEGTTLVRMASIPHGTTICAQGGCRADGLVGGGGLDNIAFLLGDRAATQPNAQTTQMSSFFWIETVQHVITVPPWTPGQPPLIVPAQTTGGPAPVFSVEPPTAITQPRQITVTSTQIQYSQKVILNFNGILWPHVSVATLVPNFLIPVLPSQWP